jgi:hypothetical protein
MHGAKRSLAFSSRYFGRYALSTINRPSGEKMKWPTVDPQESFEEVEKRLNIGKETNDIRPTSLGVHPSASFYAEKEPQIDLERMRAHFDRIANRY